MSRRSDLAAATDELKGTANSSRESRTPKFYKVAKKVNSRSKDSVCSSERRSRWLSATGSDSRKTSNTAGKSSSITKSGPGQN
jgi:hypothetical protein